MSQDIPPPDTIPTTLLPKTTPKPPASPLLWQCGSKSLQLHNQGVIMGILNVTPDSFSDGGKFSEPQTAVARALQMEQDGASIIDIGGESTRPGAPPVPLKEELRRVIPVLREIRKRTSVLISIDTSKAETARQALLEGADIINDVTALRGDPLMPALMAESTCGIVLMHMQGSPQTMQISPRYDNVVTEIRAFLTERITFCTSLGINPERLCIDPGIGFGKLFEHNRDIIASLPLLTPDAHQQPPRPMLLGVSRKSFLAAASGAQSLTERLWPGVAITAWARIQGVRIFRVHDVREHLHALRVAEAILSHA